MKISEAAKIRILYFLVLSCTASWLPIFADYLQDQGLSGVQIGFVLSITPFMMFVVQPFYGALADRIGYRTCLIVSTLFAAISFALFLIEGGFLWLVVITTAMSLFYNSIQPLLDSLSLNVIEKSGRGDYGSIRFAGALGWAVSGIIVGYFIDSINTSVIFVYSSSTLLLAFVIAFSIFDDSKRKQTGGKDKHNQIIAVLANRHLLFLLVCVFLVSAGATTIWNFYSIYMKENGASAALVGYGLSLQGLCELPLFYFSARIIGKLGMKGTLILTVLATALRLFLYSVVADPHAALFIELLHGFSWSLFWVVCVACVNKLVEDQWRATGQSLLYAAYFGIGAIAGNFWTGYLYDTQLKMATIFLLNAGVILFVVLLILMFMRQVKMEEVPAKAG